MTPGPKNHRPTLTKQARSASANVIIFASRLSEISMTLAELSEKSRGTSDYISARTLRRIRKGEAVDLRSLTITARLIGLTLTDLLAHPSPDQTPSTEGTDAPDTSLSWRIVKNDLTEVPASVQIEKGGHEHLIVIRRTSRFAGFMGFADAWEVVADRSPIGTKICYFTDALSFEFALDGPNGPEEAKLGIRVPELGKRMRSAELRIQGNLVCAYHR